ncbi:hypothetical protein ATCV1_z259R [Acanthocystis turfacea chlorella virus 1]|uniref:Uncharacterized protein z259R n=1 Tax=Chlorovirus heliozoae TaxID=322019 RepID=A7K8L9_9PHYC|nr:hypothetical protein ATCV1_z259R [Acanthocystis turfacea chlorella virus 1]ABT16393.1 hypothetical protein ATCV1_z259R [Acanthocystis turfacea chlorella virus 1]
MPDARMPDACDPDACDPDACDPDARDPDARMPDARMPDACDPDACDPDACDPDARDPDARMPDARMPDACDPDACDPDACDPDACDPDARDPDACDPDARMPDAVPERGSVRVLEDDRVPDDRCEDDDRLGDDDRLEEDDRCEDDDRLEDDDLGVSGLKRRSPVVGDSFLALIGVLDAVMSTFVGTPHLKFSELWNELLYSGQSIAIALSNRSVCATSLFSLTASANTNVLTPSGSLVSLGPPFVREKSAWVFRRRISLSIFSSSGSCFFETPSLAKVLGIVEKYLNTVTVLDADLA